MGLTRNEALLSLKYAQLKMFPIPFQCQTVSLILLSPKYVHLKSVSLWLQPVQKE